MRSVFGPDFAWFSFMFFLVMLGSAFFGKKAAEFAYLAPRPVSHHVLTCAGEDFTTSVKIESIDDVFTVWGFKDVKCQITGG